MHHCMLISLRVRHGLRSSDTPPGSALSDFHSQPGHTGISSDAPFHGRPTSVSLCPGSRWSLVAASGDVRLGRRGELHPPAPSVAAPALLEACGFSVCSVEDWRSSTCWVGNPARPVGQCVFAVGGLPGASSREGARGRSPQLAFAPAAFTFSSDGRRIAWVLRGIGKNLGTSICLASLELITLQPRGFREVLVR
jgi:hypothetical protein